MTTNQTSPTNQKIRMWIPTRPYTLIDGINRVAAATGSIGYAMGAAYANYNGHHVSIYPPDYVKYWRAIYFWGERVTLCRGTLEQALRAAKDEYDRGAKGASASFDASSEEEAQLAEKHGFVRWSEESEADHKASFQDARFAEINNAFWYEKHAGVPAVGYLANSATIEEYNAKIQTAHEERRPSRVAKGA